MWKLYKLKVNLVNSRHKMINREFDYKKERESQLSTSSFFVGWKNKTKTRSAVVWASGPVSSICGFNNDWDH